jgi:hypothetical protein
VPQTQLTVKHRGAVVPMTSAVAVKWGDDSIHVLVANNPISCAEALGSARVGTPRDDVSFYAGVSQRLAPDGSWSWALTSFTGDAQPEAGELAPAQLAADPTRAKTVDVTFTHANVSGTVVARACGDLPIGRDDPAIAKVPHPSTAVITVAGQKVAIVSAWRFQTTTYLSSEPATCAQAALPTRVTLVHDAAAGANGNWSLAGGWFAQGHALMSGGLTAAEGARGDSPDGPTVSLALSGAATIDGYPVALSGTIEALACTARK